MHINCPSCNTCFAIDKNQAGTTNEKKVKCSKCSYIWNQKFIKNPVTKDVYLPALLPKTIPWFLYMMPVFMIGIIVVMFILIFSNSVKYKSFFRSNFLIKDIDIQKNEEFLSVKYKVFNTSSQIQNMKFTRIRIFSKDNRLVKNVIDDHKNERIPAGEYLEIESKFISLPCNIDNIDIMTGNKVDLMLN